MVGVQSAELVHCLDVCMSFFEAMVVLSRLFVS